MRIHQIEIDHEVFTFLKAKAEAFVDTPNDVLRRELLKKNSKSSSSQPISNLPEVAADTPQALAQILHVAYLVRVRNLDRIEATEHIAREHGVKKQTVIDKYTRQIKMKAADFDKLLYQPDPKDLKNLLKHKFRNQNDLIECYLSKAPLDLNQKASSRRRYNRKQIVYL